MKIPRAGGTASMLLALSLFNVRGALFAFTASSPAQSTPDNSKQNQTENQGKTADSQPNAKADRLLTAKVRRAIMADKDLSTYAHNVKIVTMGGAVTLKGPVKSEEEKQKVALDAATATSADKVTNQLTVKQ